MLFNRKLIAHHRSRLIKNIHNFKFLSYAINDIIERLKCVDKDFKTILDLGCRDGKSTYLVNEVYKNAHIISSDISSECLRSLLSNNKITIDEEQLMLDRQFDLITYCLGLHWINDIERFLLNINHHLLADGVFIGNFIGGDSLKNLRHKLIEVEDKTIKKHSPHLPPFIMFEHVGTLLSRAGFKEVIVDQEKIVLEYKSPLALMRELNKFGESSKLLQRAKYSITKSMYQLLLEEDAPFIDTIYLISFIASKTKGTLKIK